MANLPNRREWIRLLVTGSAAAGIFYALRLVVREPVSRFSRLMKVPDTWKKVFNGEQAIVVLEGVPAYAVADRTSTSGLCVRSSICTHAGCPLEVNATQDRLVCRCHGGVFRADGTVESGPPKKPLPILEHDIIDHELYVRIPAGQA